MYTKTVGAIVAVVVSAVLTLGGSPRRTNTIMVEAVPIGLIVTPIENGGKRYLQIDIELSEETTGDTTLRICFDVRDADASPVVHIDPDLVFDLQPLSQLEVVVPPEEDSATVFVELIDPAAVGKSVTVMVFEEDSKIGASCTLVVPSGS